MPLAEKLENANKILDSTKNVENGELIERIIIQLNFAKAFADAMPENAEEWNPLVEKAADAVVENAAVDAAGTVRLTEEILSPIGNAAKRYKIHCIGHAHIDMNWMWSWPETANNAHDTFYTVDRLMDMYPEAKFSQSQVSLYKAMRDYFPAVYEKIKKRIKSGNWEVTASTWVECEKNNASGEALVRHMLYSKKYLAEAYGLAPEDVKIDWSADVFGHAATIPSIMSRGGVKRYYYNRPGGEPHLFVWKSKDGSELLAFRDPNGYSGAIDRSTYDTFCYFIKVNKATEVNDFLWCYGWGDHGGGPTRGQIETLIRHKDYPIIPKIDFSTTDEFFAALENTLDRAKLPVIEDERNFEFDGCFTSQSNIKYANRFSELELPSAETLALIANKTVGSEYPGGGFEGAWQKALFNQFHDIFPGSGVRQTYNYSQGLFQEILAVTSSAKNHAIRSLAERIDTASITAKASAKHIGDSLGAGTAEHGKTPSRTPVGGGDLDNTLAYDSYGVTTLGLGNDGADPIVVYNPKPWKRTELVAAKIWNKKVDPNKLCVYDADGNKVGAQLIDQSGFYWFHTYYTLLFEAKDIPALGYKVFVIDTGEAPTDGREVKLTENSGTYTLENEYLRITVDGGTAALTSAVDKQTGFDYVKPGQKIGQVNYEIEDHNGMTAWCLSPVKEKRPLEGGKVSVVRNGANSAVIRSEFNVGVSSVFLDTALSKGSRRIDFTLRTRWLEVGDQAKGIPGLRAYFPTSLKSEKMHYEIPFGSMDRAQSSQEIPALKWMTLCDGVNSATLVNRAKYGHRCEDGTLSLCLLRASYNPDPYPELGDHEIEYAVILDGKPYEAVTSVRYGEDYNNPPYVANSPIQSGELPAEKSFGAVITPNVNISAIKKAESGEGIIIRLYELSGKDTEAEILLCGIADGAETAVETDLLEKPLASSTARIKDGKLTVKIGKFANSTVLIKP